MGQRVIGISGSLIWSNPWWNLYLTPMVNFSEVRRAQLAKSTLLNSMMGSWDFFRSFKICLDLLRSVQMLKREWGAKSNRKLPHIFIPSKTRFLSLRRKTCLWAELQPWCLSLQWNICPWAEHSDADESLIPYQYSVSCSKFPYTILFFFFSALNSGTVVQDS